ncbi:FadR/GntR family transcriptional regulator [Trinickia mobilis]|uniref:FadR/GntR family transcriptional regulator n=1 Tax=Trinickia mobilis TaxID=2816356 RepID=UPI001A8C8734|nr:FCD domain-containing protein [Trinickia mobilis]
MTSLQLFHVRQSDAIVSHIKTLIAQRVLKPGDRIPSERDLAAELGLGRGTVREAMQQLEALGLVERKQRDRYVSTGKSEPNAAKTRAVEDQREFLLQVIDVRIGLESWVAAEVAAKAEAADVRKLKRIVSELDRAASLRSDMLLLDREFHRTLVEATRNPVVLQVLDSLLTMISAIAAFKKLTLDPAHAFRTDLHHAVVDAIERHDPSAARAAMTAHLKFVRDAVQGL